MTNFDTQGIGREGPDRHQGARRSAGGHDGKDAPDAAATLDLTWPRRWPAALYRGDIGAACEVLTFTATCARVKLSQPPAKGAQVALKFSFTVYLRGTVTSSDGDTLELAFDDEARRSARVVEDVLLSHDAATHASAA